MQLFMTFHCPLMHSESFQTNFGVSRTGGARRRELRASRSDLHIANESIAVCTICKSTYIVECIDRNYGPHNVNYGKCSFIEILNYLKLAIKT